jgi:plastocyanin
MGGLQGGYLYLSPSPNSLFTFQIPSHSSSTPLIPIYSVLLNAHSLEPLDMHFTSYFVVLTLAAATASAATTHQVAVGQNGLRYTPNVTYADVGDTVVFTFYPRNHNVVQGSFDTPCMSDSTGGIHSGFIPSTIGAAVRLHILISLLIILTKNRTAPSK